ncbi:hypothetical protein [Halonatronum saccharophilum]|uniref:hypothetical protein n=1 Tax=Halonatronum saccharophilum TaxID=150060 RepID=UPI0004858B7B|nr:hypothetical protein [Halonatronum saccharophilum]
MKRSVGFALFLLLVFSLVNTQLVHGIMGEKEVPKEEKSLEERLNLSASQTEEIELLKERYLKEKEVIKEELRAKEFEFKEKYLDKSVDSKVLTLLQEEIIYLKNKLFRLRNEYKLEIRELLSEEQLKEWVSEWESRKSSCHKEKE